MTGLPSHLPGPGLPGHGGPDRGLEVVAQTVAAPGLSRDDASWLGVADTVALMADIDRKGRFVDVSQALCAATGHARADLVGKSYRRVMSEATRLATRLSLRRRLAAGGRWRGDFALRTRAGGVVWIDAVVTPRHGAAGCTVFGFDVTQRKQTEEALRRSETLYRSTMMALTEGVFVVDAGGRIVASNTAAERILGLSHDEITSPLTDGPRWQAVGEDGRPLSVREYPAMVSLATGQPQRDVTMGLIGPDNHVTWLSVNAEPIFEDGSAKPTSVITSFSDITARKQAQEVLSEAIAVIPDGFAIYDRNDRLVMCNDAYRALYPQSSAVIRLGARFDDMLWYGIARGQYPQAGTTPEAQEAYIAERLRLHRAPFSEMLQQLPHGRWVQVRERRTPSGYTVGLRIDVSEIKRQSATLQALVDNFPGGVSFFDSEFNLVVHNEQFRTLLDLPAELFANGPPTLEMIFRANAARGEYGPGDPDKLVRARLDLARKGQAHIFERIRPDGTVIEVRGTPTPDGGFITTYVDMTARRAAERLLSDSERRAREKSAALQITLAHMSQGLTMFDADGRLMVWNDRYIEMYGLPPEVVTRGARLTTILACCRSLTGLEPSIDSFVRELRREIALGRSFSSTWRLNDGRVIAVAHTPTADGGWVSTHEDITERERAARQISHLAHHDALTGLANRAAFKAQVEAALARATRRGDSISVLLVDLDRFKAVNDTLGHAAGDKLLQAVAERMCQQVRAGDVVARLGGDEFAILQDSEPDQREAAAALAARLIGVISELYELDGRQMMIGASIGIAIAPEGGNTVGQLLRSADLALYKVKGSGRNAFRIYDEGLDSEAHIRCRLENDLRAAIAAGALEVHYQPIVSLHDERVCGMEALVRWPHPSCGLLAPDQFISLAEDTGLIVPLGEWVLGRACRDAASWPSHVKLAVNISPTHIRKRTLVDAVARALAETGLRPDQLEIEVTETVLLLHEEHILSELHQLRGLGVAVVLDDFGTGYSSLSHLRMFAFDKIKIDRLFVAEITERPDCAAIVCAVTGLARSLDMVTTAEGVETEEQAQLLRAAGCTEAQGYLFGRPRPVGAVDFAATAQTPGRAV